MTKKERTQSDRDDSTLTELQQQIDVPKGQYNQYGGYNYRSAEDILEVVKPRLGEWSLTLSDEIVQIGERYYIKATATLSKDTETHTTYGYARESDSRKGMDAAQITGSASSYARKYALNGLFAIADNDDPDKTNKHQVEEVDVEATIKKLSQATNLTDLKKVWISLSGAQRKNKEVYKEKESLKAMLLDEAKQAEDENN